MHLGEVPQGTLKSLELHRRVYVHYLIAPDTSLLADLDLIEEIDR